MLSAKGIHNKSALQQVKVLPCGGGEGLFDLAEENKDI
jgi:hypothetical protein